jgi:hypothetical protein
VEPKGFKGRKEVRGRSLGISSGKVATGRNNNALIAYRATAAIVDGLCIMSDTFLLMEAHLTNRAILDRFFFGHSTTPILQV